MTPTVERPAGRALSRPRCRWCAGPIHLVFAGGCWAWAHVEGSYCCRGDARAVLPTHAEPAPY